MRSQFASTRVVIVMAVTGLMAVAAGAIVVANTGAAPSSPSLPPTTELNGGEAQAVVVGPDGGASLTQAAPAVATKPYDATLPVDLGGVPGVTTDEQARAEDLVTITLQRLPQWADPAKAEAVGFRSIGDGLTGFEHYINWSYIDDGTTLDPDRPESLVYRVHGGTKTLEAVMYMLPPGSTLDAVPDVGGPLTQWHIHDNLCFSNDPVAPHVVGLTATGTCRAPTVKLASVPMIHVWIVPEACGPFSALEGVGAGQIQPGEQRACDHVHGSGGDF
jgi:hypothetical protein